METQVFQVPPLSTNCYVMKQEGKAIVVDPGGMTSELAEVIRACEVAAVVNTHAHFDHCGGNAWVLQATNAPLFLHQEDLELLRAIDQQAMMFGLSCPASPEPTAFLAEGDSLDLGGRRVEVRHVPGHSPGHIALLADDFVIAGDVLFAGSIGRTDLPGGDPMRLMESIRDVFLGLPDETVVYPGHGPATTVGHERRHNPFLVGL